MVSNKDLGNKSPYELVTEADEDMHSYVTFTQHGIRKTKKAENQCKHVGFRPHFAWKYQQ